MGWRDRDWAKFTDDERAALFGSRSGGRALPPTTEGVRRGVSRRRQRVGEWTLATFVAVGLVAFAYDHFHRGQRVQSVSLRPVLPLVTPSPRVKTKTVTLPRPRDVVAIRWRTQDLAPAAQAGRICVTDSQNGRICASYVIGERPADTLTREIEAKGLRVESMGGG